jgi:hypothetical protein
MNEPGWVALHPSGGLTLQRLGEAGQEDLKGRTQAHSAADLSPSMMLLYDPINDRQPQTTAVA